VSESGGFKTHIITNILFAFFGFMSMHRFFDLNKVIYFLLGVLSFYYSIFINDGTTGQILSISLLSILIIQKYRYKATFILPILLLGILAYGASNNNTSIYSAINKIQTGLGDFESGADIRLRNEDDTYIAEIGSREDLKKLLPSIQKYPIKFESIAFDGFSIFVQRMLSDIIEERKKKGKLKGENPTYYEWGVLSKYAKEIVLGLLTPEAHVVFTALSKTKIDQETGEILEIRPDLPKSVRKILRAIIDLECYLYADSEGERRLIFQSKKGITEVKDRSGKLSVEPANLSVVLKKVFGEKK
jgi:hypothetical protein